MKTAMATWGVLMAILLAAGGALSAEDMRIKGTGQAQVGMESETLHSAKDFIGTEVRDKNGKEVGEIKDLVFDFDHGTGYAQIEANELEGDPSFLVPLSALTADHQGDYVALSVGRDELAEAPRQEPGMSDKEYGRNLHEYYGVSYPWDDLPGDVPLHQENLPGRNLTYPGPREVIPSTR